jgi:hemerythrin-like domain-containing protein
MPELLTLVELLIAEHKTLKEKFGTLENAMNDARLITDISHTLDSFNPNSPDIAVDLYNVTAKLENISSWLEKHFSREETVLRPAVETYGDNEILSSLNRLVFEHADLRYRIEHSKKRVAELLGGKLDKNLWQATAEDVRVYLDHTITLFGSHAEAENKLLNSVRKSIKKKQ